MNGVKWANGVGRDESGLCYRLKSGSNSKSLMDRENDPGLWQNTIAGREKRVEYHCFSEV